MSAGAARSGGLRVALDHNFPVSIVDALQSALIDQLVPIMRIDERMADLDDPDVVRAVARRGFDMLVTCDHDMMSVPRVLAAVMQTRLTVVVAEGQGHDRVAASGLVLAHLPHVVAQYRKDEAQVFVLRTGRHKPKEPWDLFTEIAQRRKTSAKALFESVRLTKEELDTDPLDDD